ncbi:MAG TPA: LuxR C-terminal-related transcriptional regulator [Methylococcaceae bacterium]|nr:LuxR C-terminal-related transcriptional regulator [Methylococcaceae bacterium]
MHDQPAAGDTIRVLVADNTRIHTQLLADALKRDRQLEVIGCDSESRGVTLAAVARNIDVLVLSSNLDEQPCRGFEVLREVRASCPGIRAIILLDSTKEEAILEAFRAGARGVFSRHESIETLTRCIRCVHQGQIWANSQEMSLAVEALATSPTVRAIGANGLSLLSKRELEVVRSLAEGLTNREIAERLGLSQHTIKNYLFRVFDKLGVSNRFELLFMTLSRDATSQSVLQHLLSNSEHGTSLDDAGVAECQKAAEQGVPMAQLALAQLYGARRAGPKDLVRSYMWYLIALEQLGFTRKGMTKMLTPEQVIEAEQRAADWLSKARKMPPSRIARPTVNRPSPGAAASAD